MNPRLREIGWVARSTFYDPRLYLAYGDCGPFDGGCLIFAAALQEIYGGELFGLFKPGCFAVQHVLLKPCAYTDLYVDAQGLASAAAVQALWHKQGFIFELRPTTIDYAMFDCGWLNFAAGSGLAAIEAVVEIMRENNDRCEL